MAIRRIPGSLNAALWVVLCAALLSACQTLGHNQNASVEQEQLLGRWQVTGLRTQTIEEGSRAYIEFSEPPRLTGNGGCNQFFGVYRHSGDSLTIDSALGSTKMACAAQTMAQEQHLFQLLPEVASARLEADELTLFDAEGEVLVRATRR